MLKTRLTTAILLLFLLTAPQATAIDERLGTIEVRKSITRVTLDGWVLTELKVKNNTTRLVFDIEIHEYFHQAFRPSDNVSIKYRGSVLVYYHGVTVYNKLIIPLWGYSLMPGEELHIEYWSSSPSSGDYIIPASIVWYSHLYKDGFLRRSIYSNGLIVHLPTHFERAMTQSVPYLVSFLSSFIIFTALMNLRKHLKRIRTTFPVRSF